MRLTLRRSPKHVVERFHNSQRVNSANSYGTFCTIDLQPKMLHSMATFLNFIIITSREPGNARGNSGFPELLDTSLVGLRPV